MKNGDFRAISGALAENDPVGTAGESSFSLNEFPEFRGRTML